jgi:hypothetical protein
MNNHKTVSFWNGVQGNLQKGCLKSTMRYSSMCKVYDKLTMSKKLCTLIGAPHPNRWWGPRLQPIKPIGKYDTGFNAIAGGEGPRLYVL